MALFLSNGIYLKEEGHISLNWPEANGLNVVCLCYVYTPKAYVRTRITVFRTAEGAEHGHAH